MRTALVVIASACARRTPDQYHIDSVHSLVEPAVCMAQIIVAIVGGIALSAATFAGLIGAIMLVELL